MRKDFFIKIAPWGTPDSSPLWTDITSFIAHQGYEWTRNDIDAANSGRDTQDGRAHRRRVSQPKRLNITCRPLRQSELSTLLQAIDPEWLAVKYLDSKTLTVQTKKMYTSTVPATFLFDDGVEQWWTGVSFPLIEE